MKQIQLIVGLSLLTMAMALMACAASKPRQDSSDAEAAIACSREIFDSDSGNTIQLGVGETLCITLESNPGTGYSWVVKEMDPRFMTQTSISSPDGSSGRVGEPAPFTYHFEAAAPGQTLIRLSYERVWEQDAPAMANFEITVNIGPSQ